MLTEDMVKYLKDIIPETLKENPNLFESKDSPNNWYDSRAFFLKTNNIFLEKIKQKLETKFKKEISLEELFCVLTLEQTESKKSMALSGFFLFLINVLV